MTIIARNEYMERPTLASDLSFEGDKGVTKQADLKDTDINGIFRKWEKNGQLPGLILKDGRYGDFSDVPDYQSALETVNHANEQFQNLDASVRNRFENDPAKFLAFVTNEANIDEIAEMGLLKPEAVKARKDAQNAKAAEETAAEAKRKDDAEKALIAKIKGAL